MAVVTGANTGVGLETARGLAERGMTVVMCSRDPERGRAALEDVRASTGSGSVELVRLDLASLESVRAAAAEILERHPRIAILVNNAGAVLSDRRTTADGFEATFGVNHLGHFLLTHLLLDRLKQSAPARIVVLSSDAHRMVKGLDFDDLQARRRYRGIMVYARSKLANALFVLELAERLRGTGVTVNAVHPGVVRSGFALDGDTHGLYTFFVGLAGRFMLTPEQGALTSIHCATDPGLETTTGMYFARSRPRRPTHAALDRDAALRLWEISEQLTGLAPGASSDA